MSHTTGSEEESPRDAQLQSSNGVQEAGYPVPWSFYPDRVGLPSPEYERFMGLRDRILGVVRARSDEGDEFLDDLAEVLLDGDVTIPSDWLSAAVLPWRLATRLRKRRKQKAIYRGVVRCLLEQVFDPLLEFKMTARDILDAFDSGGIERDKVSLRQIQQVYVKVLNELKVGRLRDLMYREQLHHYVCLKVEEIKLSRQDWELNHR